MITKWKNSVRMAVNLDHAETLAHQKAQTHTETAGLSRQTALMVPAEATGRTGQSIQTGRIDPSTPTGHTDPSIQTDRTDPSTPTGHTDPSVQTDRTEPNILTDHTDLNIQTDRSGRGNRQKAGIHSTGNRVSAANRALKRISEGKTMLRASAANQMRASIA